MRRSRINYWSCSRFADWVRGEKKPLALEWNAWEEWRIKTSARRPLRFFLAEKVLDSLQDIVMLPGDMLDSVYCWYHNRFVSKTHYLKTGLRPGRFHELDNRILHGLFNEFREFVEVDLARMQAWGEKKYKFRGGRCPEAGVDHLIWASDLKYEEFTEKDDPLWANPPLRPRLPSRCLKYTGGGLMLGPIAPTPWTRADGPNIMTATTKTRRMSPLKDFMNWRSSMTPRTRGC